MGKKKKILIEEIEIPKEVEVSIDKVTISIKGKMGEIKRRLASKKVELSKQENKVVISAKKTSKREKKVMNSFKAHIKNMIRGATEGHRYELKICSGHFPMNVSVNNKEFSVKNFLGEKIPRTFKIKEGVDVKVEGDKVIVESIDKELAGHVSSDIEQLTRRTKYDTRIFQDGIYITNKDGKELK
nr:50S ribosomal protein L6P [uncultured archaeon]